MPDLHTHPTLSLPGQGPLSAVPQGCSPPTLQGSPSNCTLCPSCRSIPRLLPFILGSIAFHPGVCSLKPLPAWRHGGRGPLGHSLPLAGSDPSKRTSCLAARVRRAPCQSHGSNFPTDYPRRRRPREKQLLYPDVRTLTEGRNQERSLRALAPEGFLDKAVQFGVGGGRGRWTGAQRPE